VNVSLGVNVLTVLSDDIGSEARLHSARGLHRVIANRVARKKLIEMTARDD